MSTMSCNRARNEDTVSANTTKAEVPAPFQDPKNLIESRESIYNNIYVYRSGTNISMTFGVNKNIYEESQYNPADERELPVPYTRYMTASLMYPAKVRSVLEIGFGGGRTAWYLHRFLPDAEITAIELDPAVVELAHKYFGIKDEPHFRVVNSDGRIFLAKSKERYDVILIDAYRGPFVPFHLLTKEFYRIVQQHLAEGGVIAQNVEPSTMLFDSSVKTMHTVFAQLEFYDASNGESVLTGKDVGGNLVTIAYDGPAPSLSDVSRMAEEHELAYGLRYDLRQMLRYRYRLKAVMVDGHPYLDVVNPAEFETGGIDDTAPILSDDFAPVESLKGIEKHNRKWTATNQTAQ
jgi:spermidine synthase